MKLQDNAILPYVFSRCRCGGDENAYSSNKEILVYKQIAAINKTLKTRGTMRRCRKILRKGNVFECMENSAEGHT